MFVIAIQTTNKELYLQRGLSWGPSFGPLLGSAKKFATKQGAELWIKRFLSEFHRDDLHVLPVSSNSL